MHDVYHINVLLYRCIATVTMGRRPPHHLFVCVLTFITLIWGCMASPDGDEGSADVDVADDEDGETS